MFGCELDHRAMCSSILGCRHVPDSGGEDVSSFGSSSAEYFGGTAQECVPWLPGCIGPGVVADPGSVTTVTRLTLGSFWPLSFAMLLAKNFCSRTTARDKIDLLLEITEAVAKTVHRVPERLVLRLMTVPPEMVVVNVSRLSVMTTSFPPTLRF